MTLSYGEDAMKYAITIRLDDELDRRLDRVCEQSGRTRSDVAREALRRQLALMQFERLRERIMPFAEAQGYLTDEDVSAEVS
jgi:predicted transcriptional regulator